MTTARQNQYIPQLESAINNISAVDPESLVQRERLGSELSFEAVLPIAKKVIDIVKQLQKLNLDEVPYNVLSQLHSYTTEIARVFDAIRTISPQNTANIPQQKESYIQQLEDYWANLYPAVYSIVAAQQTEISRSEIDSLSNQVRTSAQFAAEVTDALRNKQSEITVELERFLVQKSEEFQTERDNKLAEVDHALSSIRSAAAEAGVSQNSVHFQKEAQDHYVSSGRWLVAIILLSVLLVSFSLWGTRLLDMVGIDDPGGSADVIQQVRFYLQKAIILFVLIFALILATKNYNSARHNYVVNKHRSNSLSSFTTFVASASDEQTKNAVLLQATQSIFSHQPTGYIKIDGENSPQSTVVEVLRNINPISKDKA